MRVKSVSIMVLVLLAIVSVPQTKADLWWNYDWQYRRVVTINNTGDLLTDYQIKIALDSSFDYSKSNGEDIRFVDSNNNELSYWIEKWNVSGDSIIWVKVPSIPSGKTTIYMYYGNPSASSASSGVNTFEFFDDFSTDTSSNYDMVKWVDIHGTPASGFDTPQYDSVNERMTFDTGDNIQADMYPKNFTIKNFLIRVDFWADLNYPTNATVALVGRLQSPGTSSTHYYLDFSHGSYDSPGITVDSWVNGERSNGVYSEPSDYYWEFNNVHTIRYAIYENTHRFWWNKEADQAPDIVATDDTHLDAGRVGFVPAQVRGWIDNFIVRKYVYPEPTTSIGDEQGVTDLTIKKVEDKDPVNSGDTLKYTITIKNNGDVPADNIVITETYDSNFIFGFSIPSPDIGNNQWTFDSILPGEEKKITITGTVAQNGETGLSNTVSFTSDNAGSGNATEDTTVSQIPPIIQNLWGVNIINVGSEGTFAVENGMKVGGLTLEKGENEILVDVYNKGILKAYNVRLEVLNMPWARIGISPEIADIPKRSIQTYTVSLDIPESVPSGFYIIKIEAKGNFILESMEIEVEIR